MSQKKRFSEPEEWRESKRPRQRHDKDTFRQHNRSLRRITTAPRSMHEMNDLEDMFDDLYDDQ